MRRSQACNKFQWRRALQPERSNRFELCSYRFLCSSKCTGTGYGVSESFGVSRFNDAPPRLKSTPHLSAAALPKAMRFFIFRHLTGTRAFPSSGIQNGKICGKRKRTFSQMEFQPNIHIPMLEIRAVITTLYGFPGREALGRGFQSSTRLCIIVHAFLTTLYPFLLFSSMMCNICTKKTSPLNRWI